MKPKHGEVENCLHSISTRSWEKKTRSKSVVSFTLSFCAYIICFALQSLYVPSSFFLFFFFLLPQQQKSVVIFFHNIAFWMTSVRCDELLTHSHSWLNKSMLFITHQYDHHILLLLFFFYYLSSAFYIEQKKNGEKNTHNRTEMMTIQKIKYRLPRHFF